MIRIVSKILKKKKKTKFLSIHELKKYLKSKCKIDKYLF